MDEMAEAQGSTRLGVRKFGVRKTLSNGNEIHFLRDWTSGRNDASGFDAI
jgi:hypothetical protein